LTRVWNVGTTNKVQDLANGFGAVDTRGAKAAALNDESLCEATNIRPVSVQAPLRALSSLSPTVDGRAIKQSSLANA
jgi:hypothetical protein